MEYEQSLYLPLLHIGEDFYSNQLRYIVKIFCIYLKNLELLQYNKVIENILLCFALENNRI